MHSCACTTQCRPPQFLQPSPKPGCKHNTQPSHSLFSSPPWANPHGMQQILAIRGPEKTPFPLPRRPGAGLPGRGCWQQVQPHTPGRRGEPAPALLSLGGLPRAPEWGLRRAWGEGASKTSPAPEWWLCHLNESPLGPSLILRRCHCHLFTVISTVAATPPTYPLLSASAHLKKAILLRERAPPTCRRTRGPGPAHATD